MDKEVYKKEYKNSTQAAFQAYRGQDFPKLADQLQLKGFMALRLWKIEGIEE